jgi:phage tail protein X
MSTQASDLFLYMSALAFPKEVHWVEFRLVRFDRKSSESIGEHLFFLPRVETATWNLRRVRGQLLDTIFWHEFGALGTSFRLSLWPRMEPLPHSSRLTLPSLAALPTTVSLDPRFLVHNILGNYK